MNLNPLTCRATPNRLRAIPPVARCACGEIVIASELRPGELRWCWECREFVDHVVRACGGVPSVPALPNEGLDLFAHLENTELRLIEQALDQGGSIHAAAKLLRLNRTTLSEKIRKYAPVSERLAAARGVWKVPQEVMRKARAKRQPRQPEAKP